jgi:hypothetical protein
VDQTLQAIRIAIYETSVTWEAARFSRKSGGFCIICADRTALPAKTAVGPKMVDKKMVDKKMVDKKMVNKRW